MLPEIIKMTPERQNFPTLWQTVIFRNYRRVPAENIAKVLGCTSADVEREAARLGLRTGECDPVWLERGYITIIRNNWFILTYEQLADLLGFTMERLEFAIMKEDFLWVKLCNKKPECEPVAYSALTDAQIAKTEAIAANVRALYTFERRAFDFFTDTADTEPQYTVDAGGNMSIVHPFLSPCSEAFGEDTRSHLPDSLLDAYAKQGVKALFLHALLATLSPYPYDPEQSRDYKLHRKNLKDLIDRAAKRGIKIILYFDEPRSIPNDKFSIYGKAEIEGRHIASASTCLCLETQEPQEYLYSATRDLFEAIPEIGGIFNITMSEYPTHCRSGGIDSCDCPRCKDLPNHTLPARVNNIMHKAIRDAGSNAEVIAYTWAWNPARKWDEQDIDNVMKELHPDIAIMQVSENRMDLNKGGIESKLSDYSISNPGPSAWSAFVLKTAAKYGHKLYAKVQMACSWECATVPCLPVFDIEVEHLSNLHKFGTDNFMLTWTLGGYPSITYDVVSEYLKSPENFDIEAWYEKHFGKDGETVHKAIKLFCEGFVEYPHSGNVLYFSAKNLGPANLWSLTPNDNPSAMVSYAFDDIERYAKPYPIDIYLSQFNKLLEKWNEGCKILESVKDNEAAAEVLLYARFATLQLYSDVVHTHYVLAKRRLPESKNELLEIFAKEREIMREQLALMEKSSLIGFETSNHYFFTEREYIEKLVQLDGLEAELKAL